VRPKRRTPKHPAPPDSKENKTHERSRRHGRTRHRADRSAPAQGQADSPQRAAHGAGQGRRLRGAGPRCLRHPGGRLLSRHGVRPQAAGLARTGPLSALDRALRHRPLRHAHDAGHLPRGEALLLRRRRERLRHDRRGARARHRDDRRLAWAGPFYRHRHGPERRAGGGTPLQRVQLPLRRRAAGGRHVGSRNGRRALRAGQLGRLRRLQLHPGRRPPRRHHARRAGCREVGGLWLARAKCRRQLNGGARRGARRGGRRRG